MIRIIAAVSNNGVIGVNGGLPWQNKYPEDLKFFKEKTKNSTVIMGRSTFLSIGKALPNRRNIVLSKIGKSSGLLDKFENIEMFSSLEQVINNCNADENVWVIGGEAIYQEAMKYADEIYLTLIPEFIDVEHKEYAKFPWINPAKFKISDEIINISNANNYTLNIAKYIKNI